MSITIIVNQNYKNWFLLLINAKNSRITKIFIIINKDVNYDNISSRSIVDAGVSYKFKNGFGITGSVKNLFNKKYYDYQGKNNQTGIYEYSPANERNYYVEFKYTY